MSDKVRENRARRAAARQGLALQKSRRRDPRALGYDSYRFVDIATNSVGYGGGGGDGAAGYSLDLDDVEKYLDITEGSTGAAR